MQRRRLVPLLMLLAIAGVRQLACQGGADRGHLGGAPEPLRIAVASNFAFVAKQLAAAFEEQAGPPVEISTGSSGKLCAQIEHGAPFHVFLSADEERPLRLEQMGLGVVGTRFRYAVGRLALYGPAVTAPENGPLDLKRGKFKHLSIANPEIAPYGRAAKQVLSELRLWDRVSSRIVRGENIGQAYQFVKSGGAELGFVAMSSIVDEPKHRYWPVPEQLHEPIGQGAVLLRRGEGHVAARRFVDFLGSRTARGMIVKAGYGPGGRP